MYASLSLGVLGNKHHPHAPMHIPVPGLFLQQPCLTLTCSDSADQRKHGSSFSRKESGSDSSVPWSTMALENPLILALLICPGVKLRQGLPSPPALLHFNPSCTLPRSAWTPAFLLMPTWFSPAAHIVKESRGFLLTI